MNVAVASGSPAASVTRKVRVMIVDDAVVIRGLFARWIEAEPDLEIVASLRTGREALSQIERVNPDIVLLDIEMPDLDGLTALPMLLAKKPDVTIIMASTLTRRNAEISLRSLALGATDYIPKPTTDQEVTGSPAFRRELVEKVRALGLRAIRLASMPAQPRAFKASGIARSAPTTGYVRAAPAPVAGPSGLSLRPFPSVPPRVLLIGSSTGGPQALNTVVPQLDRVLDRAPVLITQHMPPTFTTILAEHLARLSNRPTREGRHGEEINPGNIYIAPGGKHMKVARRDNAAVIELDDGPMVNFCKPSVDPMFSSAAAVWGNAVLGVVLTGMGSDGLRGAKEIVAAGGAVVAQDEATSVIWGMPGQVANAGVCSAVLPLAELAPRMGKVFAGDRA
ncbi:MAG TPA: chemotaxis response regulator protein-glutamate methylesterase [Pseudolabrys sp.]|nr:chemotaxis response regulator protein-glutamate methylesterase [Pseudolabrys sp.]